MNAHPARLAGIDNLRFLVVVLVVVLHGATRYLVFASDTLLFSLLVTALEAPLFPLLFFIAGYFSVFSLRITGSVRYAGRKILYLGPAWIAGVFLVAPFLRYLEPFLFQTATTITERGRGLLQGAWYARSVYGFFGVLLLCYLAQAALYRLPGFVRWFDKAPGQDCERCRRRRKTELLVFFLVVTAGYFLVLRLVATSTWPVDGYLVLVRLTRAPLYVGYFSFGVIAGRARYLHREWLRDEKAWPQLRLWIPLAVVSSLGYLVSEVAVPAENRFDARVQLVTAVILNGMVLSWLLSGIAIARRYLELRGRRWKRANANSAGVFFLHPLFLSLFIAAERALPRIPSTFGFPIVIIATVAVSWLTVEGIRRLLRRSVRMRRIPSPS